VVDRNGLESRSCECYEMAKRESGSSSGAVSPIYEAGSGSGTDQVRIERSAPLSHVSANCA